MKKKIILSISIFGSIVAYSLFHTRELSICNIYCGDAIDKYQNLFLFFPFIFLFSLITYFAPERVFTAWWKFARISILIIFILSLAINLELHHDPQGELQNMFDIPALILLYSIFCLGSIIQIYRGWRQAK